MTQSTRHRRRRKRARGVIGPAEVDSNIPIDTKRSLSKDATIEGDDGECNEDVQDGRSRRRKMVPTMNVLGDDSSFAFLENHPEEELFKRGSHKYKRKDPRYRHRCGSNSLPILLEQRRSGIWTTQQQRWQSVSMISTSTTSSNRRKSSSSSQFRNNRAQQQQSHNGQREIFRSRRWRDFAARSIPFSQLGTPSCDAVLGLERYGSYVLALGGAKETNNLTGGRDGSRPGYALALRFYGVPSPSSLQTKLYGSARTAKSVTTPLLQTTVLVRTDYDLAGPRSGRASLGDHDNEHDQYEQAIFNFRRGVSPTTTPVQLFISSDWRIGMARLLPNVTPSEDEDPLGRLVLFALPDNRGIEGCDSTSRILNAFQCTNVHMGTRDIEQCHNLLWHVNLIPIPTIKDTKEIISAEPARTTTIFPKGLACDKAISVPGYLVLNDEEDGYRMTWVVNKQWDTNELACQRELAKSPITRGIESQKYFLTVEDRWEVCHCESLHGALACDSGNDSASKHRNGITVVLEAFLNVELILVELLSRHKRFREERPTEFHYYLSSITCGGRVAELVLSFATPTHPSGVMVFVRVDLFRSNRIQGMDWSLRAAGANVDETILRYYCYSEALDRRMRHTQAGPYSVWDSTPRSAVTSSAAAAGSSQALKRKNWSIIIRQVDVVDRDEEDDYEPCIWESLVEESGGTSMPVEPPKSISLSSLYPDCDILSNKAVTSYEPVSLLQCKSAPLKLYYG